MGDVSCSQRRKQFLELLSSLKAEDIFIPISMTSLLNIEDSYQNILKLIRENNFSYYPVYEDGIDNILGILNSKSILLQGSKTLKLKSLIETPLFISENMRLDELFLEFLKKKKEFAIVVDEYGSIRGIITNNDILKALYGPDETQISQNFIIKNNNKFFVDTRMPIEEFNKFFHWELQCDDCDTIGGYIIEQFTYVPQNGETKIIEDRCITITKSEGAKLQEITIENLE